MKSELVFLTLICMCSAGVLPSTTSIQNFAYGFCAGISGNSGVLDLQRCLQNKESIWDSLLLNISRLSDFSYLLENISETMIGLTASVIQLVNEILPCVNSGSFLMRILEITSSLSPIKLFMQAGKAMFTKSSQLMNKLKEIYNASISKDSYRIGRSIAEFILLIFVTKYFMLIKL